MRTHCITIDLANQGRRQVRARFDGGRMSSDGGALLLQAVDQRIGLTRRLAVCGSATGAIRWPARAPSTGSSWAPPSRPRRTATSASWPTRSGRGRGRVAADRGADPAALAAGAGGGAGGRRVLPRRVDGVVRGGRGRRLRVRPGPERAAEAGARAAASGGWWARRSGCRAGCAGTTSASW